MAMSRVCEAISIMCLSGMRFGSSGGEGKPVQDLVETKGSEVFYSVNIWISPAAEAVRAGGV